MISFKCSFLQLVLSLLITLKPNECEIIRKRLLHIANRALLNGFMGHYWAPRGLKEDLQIHVLVWGQAQSCTERITTGHSKDMHVTIIPQSKGTPRLAPV